VSSSKGRFPKIIAATFLKGLERQMAKKSPTEKKQPGLVKQVTIY
jgi:hypothetical protein